MLCFRLCFVPDSFNARTCHCQDLLVRLPDLPGTIDPQDLQDPRDQRDQGWNMLEHVETVQAGHSRPFGILLGWMILAGAQKYFRHWEHWPTVSAGPDEIQHVSSIQMHPACFKTCLSTVPTWFSQAALAPTLPTALSRPNRLVASSLAM